MRRSSKSRCGHVARGARGVVTAALIAVFALAFALLPGTAMAGECEYCLELPEGDGGGQDPSANASGGGGGVDQPDSSNATEATAPEETVTTPETTDDTSSEEGSSGGGTGGNNGKGGGNGGGPSGEGAGGADHETVSATDPTGTVDASPASSEDSGGGVSGLLIAIAAIAALAVGVAVWRLRSGRESGGSGDSAPTTELDKGAQSL